MKAEKNVRDLFLGKEAVTGDEARKIDEGVKRFILEIIEKHGPIARRLCNKDPFALKYMKVKLPKSSTLYPSLTTVYDNRF